MPAGWSGYKGGSRRTVRRATMGAAAGRSRREPADANARAATFVYRHYGIPLKRTHPHPHGLLGKVLSLAAAAGRCRRQRLPARRSAGAVAVDTH